ncbi:MAG: acid phosphatase, partial [Burkholderiales bacterium]|nr:acid phosphatase [Burkholderiales bacterium]
MKPATLVVGLLASLVAACALTPGTDTPIAVRGEVPGFAGATVCLDRNANARCDAGEPSTVADAAGRFELAGRGELLAEADLDAHAVAPGGPRRIVLRAPAGASAVLGPVSTELVALMQADHSTLADATTGLARRIGVPEADLLAPPGRIADARVRRALQTENAQLLPRIAAAVAAAGATGDRPSELRNRLALDAIRTLVVIYAENRAFDTLFGLYPGANGVPGVNPSSVGPYHPQRDFDGSVLPVLPPAWGGLTAPGQPVTLTQAQTTGLPNRPFRIDDPQGVNGSGVVVGPAITTRDLVHRYYTNRAQIDGGRNDGFAAGSDAGGLTMGYYDGSGLQLWQLAQHYTLADHFFMGAFGGSFLNHQYLVCA